MGYDAIVPGTKDTTSARYTYEIIETLEPVRAAFEEALASGIDQVALVIIKLHYEQEARLAHTTQSSAYLLSNLRPMVRKTDCAFLFGNTLYFVLRGANQQGGSIVEARLWEALLWRVHNMTEREFLRPASMTIGHSGFQGVKGEYRGQHRGSQRHQFTLQLAGGKTCAQTTATSPGRAADDGG